MKLFDSYFVFVFGFALSAREAFGQTLTSSCGGNSETNSNGCIYGFVSGNCVLTVTNCSGEFTFGSVSGNGRISVPSGVPSVNGASISGNGCLATEDAATTVSVLDVSGNGKIANGGSCGVCIAGENPLWSCTKVETILARDVSIGDSIRVAAAAADGDDDDGTTCSDVYYVYRHEGLSPALRFHVSSGNDRSDNKASSFAVSRNHIVYVGTSFEDRRPVLSQDVKLGDKLVTAGKGSAAVDVVKIESDFVDLVNVLTVDPHLEIQTGGDGSGGNVVISAHSYDEVTYGAIFAPVKYVYLAFGPAAVEYMKPLFDYVDASMTKPSFRGVANKLLVLDA
mmetsp:Transcript_17540/g.25958  ORF Transcript_17540/g.25958 Transcript_17540/m.25958 type:complete len:338 (+) Transcript_17540:43-1056(+)